MEKKTTISLRSWVRSVAFSKRKLKQLYEQLEYLKMKMNGCCSPTYGREFNVPSDPYKNQMLYWLDKLTVVEEKIKELENDLKQYEAFRASLSERELFILDKYFIGFQSPTTLAVKLNISRGRFYEIVASIERKNNR